MAKLSNLIEAFIKQLFEDTNGVLEIQRNELASRFNCVPSQINYVIETRFSSERGYYVESRRGGGGCIKISRISSGPIVNYLMHIIPSIGDRISRQSAEAFISNFIDYNAITVKEGMLMKAAISDKVLCEISFEQRNYFRSLLLKNMLISIAVS